jgi:sarcosine oxidase
MKTTSTHYDCIVIGKGLIGSAAAKYLKQTFESVVIIGPDEPLNYNDAQVYASHYDQGRVQRIIGIDETWSRLNNESANQYQQLQNESGINFHFPVGCLYVSPFQKDNYLINAPNYARGVKNSPEFFDSAESISNNVPHYVFPNGSHGMLEGAPSGHINPMLLLKAQLNVFVNAGGHSINDTVTAVL